MSFPSCEEIHRRFRFDKVQNCVVRITSPGGGVPAGAALPNDWTTIDGEIYATKKIAWVLHRNEPPPSAIWSVRQNQSLAKDNLESTEERKVRRYKPPRKPMEAKRKGDEEVRDYILRTYKYDAATGIVTSRVKFKRTSATPGAGSISPRGYIRTKIRGEIYLMHRIIWVLQTGDWPPPGRDLDHINRVRSDNRWVNLRLATHAENMKNRTAHKGSTSGVSGVRRYKNRWEASISHGSITTMLGRFDSMEEAIRVRREAEKVHYKEFAPG